MCNRQNAIKSLAKYNKFTKQLIYDICIAGVTDLSKYAEELTQFEAWVICITEYAEDSGCPIFYRQIGKLSSPDMLEQYMDVFKNFASPNILGSFKRIVESLKEFRRMHTAASDKSKGKYKYLEDDFAYEEAEKLFNRAVRAKILDSRYKPTAVADLRTLKVLAYAIGTCLNFTNRKRWHPFEKQWNISFSNKLSSIWLSKTQLEKEKRVIDLFPEVNFSAMSEANIENFFEPAYGLQRVKNLYRDLHDYRYISSETTVDEFLSIFNLGKLNTRVTIQWTSTQQHLVYFVYLAFSDTNRNIWVKTQDCFSIEGKTPHRDSMHAAIHKLTNRKDFQLFDIRLKRIASDYRYG